MDLQLPGHFQWPSNGFRLVGDAKQDFDTRVRTIMLESLVPYPEARALYCTDYVQRIVFAETELNIHRGRLMRNHQYNMALPYYDENVADYIINYIRANTTNMQLLNIRFGFIHSTLVPDEYMFKYPSNNTQIMPTYARMTLLDDAESLRPYLNPETVRDRIHQQFLPHYGYLITALTSVQLDVWEMGYGIGSTGMVLPTKSYLWTFPDAPDDNLCFWRALAAHNLQSNEISGVQQHARDIRNACVENDSSMATTKFDITKTATVETILKINIRWYDKKGNGLLVHRWHRKFSSTANLLTDGNHCAYIIDIAAFLREVRSPQSLAPSPSPDTNTAELSLWTFLDAPNDNKCVWRAVAAHMFGNLPNAELSPYISEIMARASAMNLIEPSGIFNIKNNAWLEHSFDLRVNWYDNHGNSVRVLHTACPARQVETVNLLIAAGHCIYINNLERFLDQTESLRQLPVPEEFRPQQFLGGNLQATPNAAQVLPTLPKPPTAAPPPQPARRLASSATILPPLRPRRLSPFELCLSPRDTDNGCVWRAIAVAIFVDSTSAQFEQNIQEVIRIASRMNLVEPNGMFNIRNNARLEASFDIWVNWYDMYGNPVPVSHTTNSGALGRINLLVAANHCILIRDLERFLYLTRSLRQHPVPLEFQPETFIGCSGINKAYQEPIEPRSYLWTLSEPPADNTSIWWVLAAHFERTTDTNKLAVAVANMCTDWLGISENPPTTFTEIAKLEELVKAHIRCYHVDGQLIELPYSVLNYRSTAHLVVTTTHCAYITDISAFLKDCQTADHQNDIECLWLFYDSPRDNNCVWRAIAAHYHGNLPYCELQVKTQQVREAAFLCNLVTADGKFDVKELGLVEHLFGVHIFLYDIHGNLLPKPHFPFMEKIPPSGICRINLMISAGHCMYISDLEKFLHMTQEIRHVDFPTLLQPRRYLGSLMACLWSFSDAPNDDKCVWRAIAAHYHGNVGEKLQVHTDRIVAYAQEKHLTVSGNNKFDIANTSKLENLFKLCIRWFDAYGRSVNVEYHNNKSLMPTLYLAAVGNHCIYIKDIEGFINTTSQYRRYDLCKKYIPQAFYGCGDWFANNSKTYLWTFPDAPADGKCFYRTLAAHGVQSKKLERLETRIESLLAVAVRYGLTGPLPNTRYKFRISQTKNFEDLNRVNIRFFDLGGSIIEAPYTNNKHWRPANILLVRGHCAYIHDLDEFLFDCQLRLEIDDQLIGGGEKNLPACVARHVWSFPPSANDDMCFWYALASHSIGNPRWPDIHDMACKLLEKVRQANPELLSATSNKLRIGNTKKIEYLLQVNIRWYDTCGNVLPIGYSKNSYYNTANLLVVDRHCVFIHNICAFLQNTTPCSRVTSTIDQNALVGCGNWFQRHHQRELTDMRCAYTFPQRAEDGKCLVRCLAAHWCQSSRKSTRLTRMLNAMYMQAQENNLMDGIFLDVSKTKQIENLFRMNIRYHILRDTQGRFRDVEHTEIRYTETIHLIASDRHFAYIRDYDKYMGSFVCHDCKKIYASGSACAHHRAKNRCTGKRPEEKSWRFISGLDLARPDIATMFQHMTALLIQVKITPRFVFFDIECLLGSPEESHFKGPQLSRIEQEHVPVSIALAYSANTGMVQNPECYVSDGDPLKMVKLFYRQLCIIHRQYHSFLQHQDYKHLLRALKKFAEKLETNVPPSLRRSGHLIRKFNSDITNDDGYISEADDMNNNSETTLANFMQVETHEIEGQEFDPIVGGNVSTIVTSDVPPQLRRKLNRVYRLMELYDLKAYQLNIIGYNSSKYDLNVLAKYLMPLLDDTELRAVKRHNRYLVVTNKRFRFTDIYLFMSPTTSLDAFVRSYLRKEDYDQLEFSHKLIFPYEYLTDVSVLAATDMPAAEFFTTTSRNTFLECEDSIRKKMLLDQATTKREQAVRDFETFGCRTMLDYLKVYNKADVAPGVRAIQNLCRIYREAENMDLFDFITLPSMAKQIALRNTPPGGHFMRFHKDHENIYHEVRKAITGGASIIWLRLAETGLTVIRPYEFGTNAKSVQRVIGLDMSGCYLWATSQEHLTGPYFLRDTENSFRIENDLRHVHSVLAIEYYVQNRFGDAGFQLLRHQFRSGEQQIRIHDGAVYSVDGYVEFDANHKYVIEFNGCYFHNHSRAQGCTLKHKENANHDAIREKNRYEQIKEQVTEIIVLWECEWRRLCDVEHVQTFLDTRPLYHTWQRRYKIKETDIVPLIMSNKLKGLFKVDAYVPKHLRCEFRDVQPFFSQMEVTWDMIGDKMRGQMLAANRKFKTRRLLLNPPFCQQQYLTHFYIKWLVEHGIIIHKIYYIVEYPLCSAPFKNLCEKICEERQKATVEGATEEEVAKALNCKLTGNAIYGQFCMQPDNHTTTKYGDEEVLHRISKLQKTCNVNKLGEELFEITYAKPKVTVTQCPQMAVGVYSHAKQRMLAFIYEFGRILDPQLYNLVLTDTDSYYFALAKPTWEECVRHEISPMQLSLFKKEYFCLSSNKSKYMGLFHVEFEGHSIAALQPKMYFAVGEKSSKTATRGIAKRENPLSYEAFKHILASNEATSANGGLVQRVFRLLNNNMTTMRAPTSAFNAFYFKRKVLDNNIDTADLDWSWPLEFDR